MDATVIFDDVFDFAAKAHGDQLYGSHPYWTHLMQVAVIVAAYEKEGDKTLRKIACLHDVLEDTTTSEDEIRNLVGEEILSQVKAITDPPGKNRKNVNSFFMNA